MTAEYALVIPGDSLERVRAVGMDLAESTGDYYQIADRVRYNGNRADWALVIPGDSLDVLEALVLSWQDLIPDDQPYEIAWQVRYRERGHVTPDTRSVLNHRSGVAFRRDRATGERNIYSDGEW